MGIFYLNPFLIAAAVLPAFFLLVRINRADKVEKEPRGLLVMLVIFGAVSTAAASIAERVGIFVLSLFISGDSLLYNAILYFVIVGLAEEFSKYFFLKRRTWNDPAFNYSFDAVVYAVYIALGFAIWENLIYVFSYGLGTALIRAVTAIPGHACFGVFMGVWYGEAKKRENLGDIAGSKTYRSAAVIMPALLHGCYDFAASLESRGYMWIFIVFVAILFITAFRLVKKTSAEDQSI